MFIAFSPRADGDFITKPVMDLLSENKIAKVPYITGVNEDEGSMLAFLAQSDTNMDWDNFVNTYYPVSTTAQNKS